MQSCKLSPDSLSQLYQNTGFMEFLVQHEKSYLINFLKKNHDNLKSQGKTIRPYKHLENTQKTIEKILKSYDFFLGEKPYSKKPDFLSESDVMTFTKKYIFSKELKELHSEDKNVFEFIYGFLLNYEEDLLYNKNDIKPIFLALYFILTKDEKIGILKEKINNEFFAVKFIDSLRENLSLNRKINTNKKEKTEKYDSSQINKIKEILLFTYELIKRKAAENNTHKNTEYSPTKFSKFYKSENLSQEEIDDKHENLPPVQITKPALAANNDIMNGKQLPSRIMQELLVKTYGFGPDAGQKNEK